MNRLACVRFSAAIAAAIALIAPATGFAQTAPVQTASADARWQPWLGCWSPAERAPRDRSVQVCIVPAVDGNGVRMATYAGEQRVLEETILADGSTQTLAEDSCRGTSHTQWALHAARLFRLTELTCDGKPPQRTTEIATLEDANEWLDVQVVMVNGSDNVRTRRYARSTDAPPAEVASQAKALPPSAMKPTSIISSDDVIEANAVVSHRAVEVWLSETKAQVPVNKRTLLALHKANVAAPVIDLMVARAYPNRFEVRRSGSGGSFGSFSDDDLAWMSPLDVMFDSYPGFYYSPFGSYRQFIDPSLYPLGGYVTVPADISVAQSSGPARVVNGSGYTRVEPRQPVVVGRTPGSTADSSDSGSSSSSGNSSSSSSGGGSASPSGYSGSGGGGGGQTAVPR